MLQGLKMNATTDEDRREIRFFMGKVSKQVHGAENVYRIPDTFREELRIVRAILADKAIKLETPIAHIVPRDPTYVACASATPTVAEGWSVDLGYYWRLDFDAEITRRATGTDVSKRERIPINALKMVALTLNIAAAICACDQDEKDLDGYPVLMNVCDDLSAGAWLNFRCKTSLMGRAMGRVLIGLLMGTNLGIQGDKAPDGAFKDQDAVKELARGQLSSHNTFLTHLPNRSSLRTFQPSSILLGMIWETLLRADWKCPLTVGKLGPQTLGSITSSTF